MAKNDFYKNFERFENVYRDFTSSTKRGAQDLSVLAPISFIQAVGKDNTTTFYVNLINTLFPLAVGGFNPAEELWNKIEKLATFSPNDTAPNADAAKQIVANCMRVYHYNGDPKNVGELERKIKDFYVGVREKSGPRPSAYSIHDTDPQPTTKGAPAPAETAAPHKKGLLRDCVPADSPPSSKLTMVLVDTPIIDMKLRGAEKVDAFLNYSPSILMSQCVPYLSAQFILNRKNSLDSSGPKQTVSMGQLKFLLGPDEINNDSSATSLMYNSSILRQVESLPTQQIQTSADRDERLRVEKDKKAAAAGDLPGQKPGQPLPPKAAARVVVLKQSGAGNAGTTTVPTAQTVTKDFIAGMELFTMPQTLINMDYDGSTIKKFQPTLNPTLPFGVITNLSVNVAGSVGVISFKSAKLTLRIFDRSRLSEIADFMNPKLYQSATIWLTYGWRAPRQVPNVDENPYLTFINENMMTREAYGIKGSSMSIEDSGTVTVTLDLFTKGASELINVSSSGAGLAFENAREKMEQDMAELKDILGELGIKSYNIGGADVRGSIIINAANNGTFPDIDYKTYNEEYTALSSALSECNNERATRAKELIAATMLRTKGSSQTKAQLDLDAAAKTAAEQRFTRLSKFVKQDLFSFFQGKFDKDINPHFKPSEHPLAKLAVAAAPKTFGKPGSVNAQENPDFNSFGKISFGRLFFNYFLDAAANASGVIDEFQVIFYSLNSRAGQVASINIAEFPIDIDLLRKAYAKLVQDQKGETMTILNFLKIVRSSQFEDIRHRAFGFYDFFTYEKDVLVSDKSKAKDFQKTMIENFSNGGSFMQPTIDFFVETGYMKVDPNGKSVPDQDTDLLRQFEKISVETTNNSPSRTTKRIMRIHVYDRAATPHHTTATIMKQADGKQLVSADITAFKSQIENAVRVNEAKLSDARAKVKQAEDTVATAKKKKDTSGNAESALAAARADENSIKTNNEKLTSQLTAAKDVEQIRKFVEDDTSGSPKTKFEVFDLENATFSTVKKKISEFTPTILIGSNGTAVKNISYTTGQDALLSTIMILRNNTNSTSVTNPNGSSGAGLPLRVIPGQLSLTTLGCPLVDYMQQYFVDLGTGTTVDNLYNITGLTHNISPGNFQTEIKLTFSDAYGQYESPQDFSKQISAMTKQVTDQKTTKPVQVPGAKKR